jgi:hypothetical protein
MNSKVFNNSIIAGAVLLALSPSAIFASGGQGVGSMLSVFLSFISMAILVAQLIVMKWVQSSGGRTITGWLTLSVAIITGIAQVYLIKSDFDTSDHNPFPTITLMVMTFAGVIVTAIVVFLGIKLRS